MAQSAIKLSFRRSGFESAGDRFLGEVLTHGFANIFSHLKGICPNSRSKPNGRLQIGGVAADFFNGSLQNAVGKAAPASVHSSNNAAAAVSNKDGQTVCRHHAGHNPARRSPLRVGFGRRLRRINIVGAEHCRAVKCGQKPGWTKAGLMAENAMISIKSTLVWCLMMSYENPRLEQALQSFPVL